MDQTGGGRDVYAIVIVAKPTEPATMQYRHQARGDGESKDRNHGEGEASTRQQQKGTSSYIGHRSFPVISS
jgi:hypothetical protein